jgi:uncharacterized protein (TIGR02453 family)
VTVTSPGTFRGWPAEALEFYDGLLADNTKTYWLEHKTTYDDKVRAPMVALLTELEPEFGPAKIYRPYRDVRFSKDKTPYKTHTGIHFRHEQAMGVHAPGFYLHLEPHSVFAATGIWRPDSATLGQIRDAIAGDPEGWARAAQEIRLSDGEKLKRAPAGYDPDHPLIDDLKRKDFVAMVELNEKTVTSAGFPEELARTFEASAPIMRFLCEAVRVPF